MIARIVCLLLLVATPVQAALTITNLTSGGDAACATGGTTASITPTAGALVLLHVVTEITAGTAGTVTATGNGATFTEVTNILGSTSLMRGTLLRAYAASYTTGTITITASADQDNCTWSVIQVTGQDTSGTNGSGAIVQSVSNQTIATGALTVTLGAFADAANATVGAYGVNVNTALVPGAGFTEVGTQVVSFGSRSMMMAQNPNAGDTTADITGPSNLLLGIATEVKNAPSAVTTEDDTQILGMAWDWLTWLISPAEADAASRIFNDGFEAGNTNLWGQDGTHPRCTVVTSATDGGLGPYAGTKMVRCNWGADYDSLWLDSPALGYTNEIFYRAWLRIDTNMDRTVASPIKFLRIFAPPNGPNYRDLFEGISDAPGLTLRGNAGNNLIPTYWGDENGGTDHSASTTAWHRVEYYLNHTTQNFRAWHDGTLVRNETVSFNSVKWTPFYLTSNWSGDYDGTNHLYFDNIEIFSDAGSSASGSMADASISEGGGGSAATYYIDANLATDCTSGNYSITNRACNGSDGNAYNDLQDACTVITSRVGTGIKGDDIVIRAGTYTRSPTGNVVYTCLWNGTTGDHTVVSAKTCSANAPGCIKRHDGTWYENVIFNNMRPVTETWTTTASTNVYKTTVDFAFSTDVWIIENVQATGTCTSCGAPRQVANDAANYNFTSIAPGPYRMLVDGVPSQWYDYDYTLTEAQNTARLGEGTHTYNRTTKVLYSHLRANKDPRTTSALVETWRGSEYWLKPRWEYVDFKGIQVRGFLAMMPFVNSNTVDYMKNVTIQGNQFSDNGTWILDPRGKRFTQFAGEGITQQGAVDFTLRSNVKFYDNIFLRQSREVFQIHGTGHEFKRNWLIDNTGQWSGGFEAFPKINCRNTPGCQVYYNFFLGHVDSTRPAPFFNIETTNEHDDQQAPGNCEYNNQEYVGNYFEKFLRATIFVIGGVSVNTGECSLSGVKFNNNIIVSNDANAVSWSIRNDLKSSSEIKNNLFYGKSTGAYMDFPATSRAATLTNSLALSDNIFMNGTTVFTTNACGATGVTRNRNIFNGNTTNGCTGTSPITTAATFANVDDRDFRPAGGSPAIVSGTDIGPYNDGSTPPVGMEFWDLENDLAPRIAALKVEQGATSTVVIDFRLGLPGFSFGPILPAASTAADCTGLTLKKNGTGNTITDCDKISDTRWSMTVTNAYVCDDTLSVSYNPTTGNITDSAIPSTLRQELVEETDFAGVNLITSGCGGTPPGVPVFTVTDFRWKRWPGPVDSVDWVGNLSSTVRQAPDSYQRLRVQVVTTVAGGTLTPTLQCNAAGGTFYTITDNCAGTGVTDAPFCFASLPDVSGESDTTLQLAACGGTFVSGKVVQNSTPHPPITMAINGCTEAEYALRVKPSLGISSTPMRCRLLRADGTALPFLAPLDGTVWWSERIVPRRHIYGGITGGGANN